MSVDLDVPQNQRARVLAIQGQFVNNDLVTVFVSCAMQQVGAFVMPIEVCPVATTVLASLGLGIGLNTSGAAVAATGMTGSAGLPGELWFDRKTTIRLFTNAAAYQFFGGFLFVEFEPIPHAKKERK